MIDFANNDSKCCMKYFIRLIYKCLFSKFCSFLIVTLLFEDAPFIQIFGFVHDGVTTGRYLYFMLENLLVQLLYQKLRTLFS